MQARRRKEAEAEASGVPYDEYTPRWFHKALDDVDGAVIHVYNGDYWQTKLKKQWPQDLPDIYS